MKYVVFTHRKIGLRFPVMASCKASHCDLRMGKDFVPTSAGFFSKERAGVWRCHGESDSLGLKPELGDEELLLMVITNLEAMLFLGQDPQKNLLDLERLLRENGNERFKLAAREAGCEV